MSAMDWQFVIVIGCVVAAASILVRRFIGWVRSGRDSHGSACGACGSCPEEKHASFVPLDALTKK